MKKLVYTLIIITGLLQACVSLEEDPRSILTSNQFYKTEDNAIAAVNAIYYNLNHSTDNIPFAIYSTLFNTGMDMMTDEVDAGPGSPNPDVRSLAILSHSSLNVRVLQIWQAHYASVNRANVAIEKIPPIDMNVDLKNRLLGEAYFLRALLYFNLVRLYGDVPLLLSDQTLVPLEELQVPRTPKNEVYTQIISDLEASSDYFSQGSSGELGRATQGAAVSLLSKVYLTLRDWQKSVNTAEEVINGDYNYDLFENYAHVFLPAYKNGKEHIFSVQFAGNLGGQAHTNMRRAIRTGVPGLVGGYGEQVVFYKQGNDNFFSIYKLYSPSDKRRDVSFVTSYVSPSNGNTYRTALNNPGVPNDFVPFFNKYWDPAALSQTDQSSANSNVIRFAEILLIHAEAENELNGPTAKAYASLNRVRNRAGLANLTEGLSQDQFRDSVYLDRRLELVYEYQRWFDLIRQTGSEFTGVGPEGKGILLKALQKVGKTNVQEKHYLYPIPFTEITRNLKLTQNPGWE
ncbi:MAG: RagB/SusD family nutrient uptake outer membrane protein [Microscillaceae bacterium]|nr:RagB/SusD family nutrient uptake outer membrane protein [Microscillaceae bacterium]